MSNWRYVPCRDCGESVYTCAKKTRCLSCRKEYFEQGYERVCRVPGCGRIGIEHRGLCYSHYKEWLKKRKEGLTEKEYLKVAKEVKVVFSTRRTIPA